MIFITNIPESSDQNYTSSEESNLLSSSSQIDFFFENLNFLRNNFGILNYECSNDGIVEYIYISSLRLYIDTNNLLINTNNFQNMLDSLLIQRASYLSENIEQKKFVQEPIKDDAGEIFRVNKKTRQQNDLSCCSICQCEFKSNEIVRKMHNSCSCIYHKNCIKKWFKNSNKCPNCGQILDANGNVKAIK